MSEHKAPAPTPAQISEVSKLEGGAPTKGSATAQMQAAYGKELNAERVDAQMQAKKDAGIEATDEDKLLSHKVHERADAAAIKAETAAKQVLGDGQAPAATVASEATPVKATSVGNPTSKEPGSTEATFEPSSASIAKDHPDAMDNITSTGTRE